MSTMQTFDMEGSRRLEAVYTTPDVVEQRRVVLNLLAARPGERAIDIGVGPGFWLMRSRRRWARTVSSAG